MVKQEIYVSTDVEADGLIPGPHSMLSFGSAAYLADSIANATSLKASGSSHAANNSPCG